MKAKGMVSWALVLLVFFSCGSFKGSELVCEEAAVHVAECCPGVAVRLVNCDDNTDYDLGGCGQAHVPDIDGDIAACLKRKDCGTLVADGTCTNLERASSRVDTFGYSNTRFLGVCK